MLSVLLTNMLLQAHEILILPWSTKGEVFLFEQLQGSLSVPLAFILKGFKKEIRIKWIYIEIYCPKCIMYCFCFVPPLKIIGKFLSSAAVSFKPRTDLLYLFQNMYYSITVYITESLTLLVAVCQKAQQVYHRQ